MENLPIKPRQAMLFQVVYFQWPLFFLVLLSSMLIKVNLVMGTVFGIASALINLANVIRVIIFIRKDYLEAAKNDRLLQALNTPVRSIPVVLLIGSTGLVLYLSYFLASLAFLAGYLLSETLAAALAVAALLGLVLLTWVALVMDKKIAKMKTTSPKPGE